MSSVQDYEKCPQCGGVYAVDFDCRTFEESKFCPRCGKEEYYIHADDKGEPVLDENGKLKYISEDCDGCGCICVAHNKGILNYYPLEATIDLEELKTTYLETLENPDVDAERSYFTYLDIEKKDVVVLFGEDPGLYGQVDYVVNEADIPLPILEDPICLIGAEDIGVI